nr:hypothetical protein [Candidatus Aminicenantes bacterium]NIT24448.1 hypothetical protein [Candidatus Aminicenantes bacterium]
MPRKSTHSGHCQLCGCIQKLPGGLMANHGYRVDKNYGFFAGACRGSRYLPFEQSTNLIEDAIQRQEKEITNTTKYIQNLQESKDNDKAWLRLYDRKIYKYYWVYAPIIWKKKTYSNSSWFAPYSIHKDTKEEFAVSTSASLPRTEEGKLEFIKSLNLPRINELKRQIKSAEEYVTWQKGRLETWQYSE